MFLEEIARMLVKQTKLQVPQIMELLEIPPDPKLGDVAFPCFILAKEWKKAPSQIAQEVALAIKPVMPVERVQTEGPYVNFFLNRAVLVESVLIQKLATHKRKEKVMVEHSNGNTHKSVHIGHLRNMVIGDALVRVLRAAGFTVVNVYYINDVGMHVAKCLWGLQKYHADEEPPANQLQWLGKIYTESSLKIKENPELKKEADVVLQKLESSEPHTHALWKKTWKWCVDGWHQTFDKIDMLPFDAKFYESDVLNMVKPIVDSMLEKGILKESDGAVVADLEEEGLHTAVIRKSDGTSTYLAKDFALADVKFNKYKIDRSVYVVGSEQELHFKQLFKILELDGFKQAEKCFHLSYGLVMLSTGKMSSRDGTVILFDELYDEVYDHAANEVKKRHEWSEKKVAETAQAITLAALKFPMVVQEPHKRIVFDVRRSLDFEGETGPYIQYTYARLSSVLRKFGKKVVDRVDFSLLESDEALSLVKLLGKESDVVEDAALKYKPALVARFLLEIAQSVNSFYHAQPVLKASEDVKKARLLLVLKAKEALKRLSECIGIPMLEEM